MKKTVMIPFVLAIIALFIVGCQPEIGPGQAIAGVQPQFHKLEQCKSLGRWKGHNFVYPVLDGSPCTTGDTKFHLFPLAGYTLDAPLQGYKMNALTHCKSHKQRRTEPDVLQKAIGTKHDYEDNMVYAANTFGCPPGYDMVRKMGYVFAEPVQGTRPVYQLYRDAWENGYWSHMLYPETDFTWNRIEFYSFQDGRDYTGLVGYFLTEPKPPFTIAAPVVQPMPAPKLPEYECTGERIGLRLNRDAEEYRVKGLEDQRFSIKLLYADAGSAKIQVNEKVSDLLKISDSFVNNANTLKVTLTRIRGDEAEFCLERSGKVCCRTRDDKISFIESPEICRAERGDVVEDRYCAETVCCEWMRTKTLRSRVSCSELEGSKSLSKKACPGGVDNPACKQLKEQCSWDISFEEAKCNVEAEKIKRDCDSMNDKLKGLRIYFEKMQKADKEYSNYMTGGAVITGAAVAAQPQYNNLLSCKRNVAGATKFTYDHYTSIGSCPQGSAQRVIGRTYASQQPNTVKLVNCRVIVDSLIGQGDCDPGTYQLSELGWAYTQKPDIPGAVKISRCVFSGEHYVIDGDCQSGSTTEGSWWILPFCEETGTGSVKSLVENKEYSAGCEGEQLVQYICTSLSPPSGVKKVKTDCPAGKVCVNGACTTSPPKMETPKETGCPAAEAAKIKDDCDKQIAKIGQECQNKIARVNKECAETATEYEALLGIIQQMQGLLKK